MKPINPFLSSGARNGTGDAPQRIEKRGIPGAKLNAQENCNTQNVRWIEPSTLIQVQCAGPSATGQSHLDPLAHRRGITGNRFSSKINDLLSPEQSLKTARVIRAES